MKRSNVVLREIFQGKNVKCVLAAYQERYVFMYNINLLMDGISGMLCLRDVTDQARHVMFISYVATTF